MKWTVLAYKTDDAGWMKGKYIYITCRSREDILKAVMEALDEGCDKFHGEKIKEVL